MPKRGNSNRAHGKWDLHVTMEEVVLRAAKAKASLQGRRISDVVADLLRQYVMDGERSR